MNDWKTVSVRLKESDIATLNQRLRQYGFETLGDLVRAFSQGGITNEHLMDGLADLLAKKIVDNLSTREGKHNCHTTGEQCEVTDGRTMADSNSFLTQAIGVLSGWAGSSAVRTPALHAKTANNDTPTIEWDDFRAWLEAQYSRKHTSTIMLYAPKYYVAIWQPAKAAELLALTPDKRRCVMESLAALSKFTGVYERWQTIRRDTGLKWESSKSLNLVKALLDQEIADILPWLREATSKIPRRFGAVLVFAALTGLRPSEACNACNLITELGRKGALGDAITFDRREDGTRRNGYTFILWHQA